MSLDRFKSAFTGTARTEQPASTQLGELAVPDLPLIISELGGQTFNHGLYRVLREDQLVAARESMEGVFPEYRGRIVPFAFDWLGRHFASDLARVENGRPLVLMLEVGAGEAMEIPASALDFHNVELVEYADDALSAPFWNKWRALNPDDLGFTDCVGYKVPLFLGGADVVANLEIIDLSVYVEICGQLRSKAGTLPPGQSIRNVAITK
jgi:hypothetical protein